MTTPVPAPSKGSPTTTVAAPPAYRSDAAPDRLMRRLLGVRGVDRRSSAAAHRAFRISVVVSAIRCVITYLLIPVLVAVGTVAGWFAAPVGLALCAYAAVNGVVSVRRFWAADHKRRWMYTAFIGVVFVILAVALISDLQRWGVIA